MATSGSFYTSCNSDQFRLQIEWSATQDVATNASTIRAVLYWISTGSAYYINSTATKNVSITIAGDTHSFTVAGAHVAGNEKRYIGEFSKTVTHDSSGNLGTTVSGWFEIKADLSKGYVTSVSTSQDISLNTISPPVPYNVTLRNGDSNSSETIKYTGGLMTLTWDCDSAASLYEVGYSINGGAWTYFSNPTDQKYMSFNSIFSLVAGQTIKMTVRSWTGPFNGYYNKSGTWVDSNTLTRAGKINARSWSNRTQIKSGTAYVKTYPNGVGTAPMYVQAKEIYTRDANDRTVFKPSK